MTTFSNLRVRTVAILLRTDRYHRFDALRDSLRAPVEVVRASQLTALRSILTDAATNTPGNRRRFEVAGIDPGQIQTAADLKKLPVITKADFRVHPDDYLAKNYSPKLYDKKSTSGSSGMPFTFYRDRAYLELGQAGTMRCLAEGGWQPGEGLTILWGFEKEVEDGVNRLKQWSKENYLLNAFRQTEKKMADWVTFLKRNRLKYLYGYPSSLSQFAEFVMRTGVSLPMRSVFCTAEKYFDFERINIEKAFECKSYDLYGSSEIQNIAFECRRGKMHVATDFVCLDEEQLHPNEPSSLVVTSLHNRVQPFIRYDLGDYGRVLAETCDCGIHTPLMEILGGSKYDFLLTPAGPLHSAVLERIFNKITAIRRYQIVQHDLANYTIRCELEETAASSTRQQIETTAQQVLQEIIQQTPVIRFEYPQVISPGPNGKYRFIYRDRQQ